MVHRFLHVANGTATTRTIEAAGIPGRTSIWADVLSEGPVPGGVSDAALIRVRAAQLGTETTVDEVVAELTEWRRVIDDDEEYDELVLWFEHDLFDQLNLIQLLSHIGPRLETMKPVSLICIGSFPGRANFHGLGELTPAELASLVDTRVPVTAPQCATAARVWEAFRASDPTRLQDTLRGDLSSLPLLSAALARYLEEFPWTTDGLSRTERRLMQEAEAAPLDIRRGFPRMHDGETAYYITDGSYLAMVEDLAASSPALITLDVRERRQVLPSGSVSLTAFGRAVLGGEEDRVRGAGLDRWLGGVHMTGFGPTWRWDPSKRSIVFA